MNEREAFTLEQIINFLCGEVNLDGVGFGDRHPNEKGAFWWRKHLKAAYARTVMGEVHSCAESSAHGVKLKDDNLASPTTMEATGLTAASGKTEGFATREDAKPVANASDEDEAQHGIINQALLNASHILANFTAGEAHEDGTLPRKLEEWRACYAKLFTQLNEVVQESLKREAQHKQKALDVIEKLESYGEKKTARIIKQNFVE